MFCSGGVNPKDPANPRDNPDNAIMVWCRDSLGWALNQWYVKVLVLLVFAGYLAGALYGTTTIQEGLQRRKLSRPDSYSIEFYDRDDFYFREFPYRIQVRTHPNRSRNAFSLILIKNYLNDTDGRVCHNSVYTIDELANQFKVSIGQNLYFKRNTGDGYDNTYNYYVIETFR